MLGIIAEVYGLDIEILTLFFKRVLMGLKLRISDFWTPDFSILLKLRFRSRRPKLLNFRPFIF